METNTIKKEKCAKAKIFRILFVTLLFNPIQDGGAGSKGPPNSFSPVTYKRGIQAPKLSDF